MKDIGIVVLFGGGVLLIFAALYAFHLNGQYKLRQSAAKDQQARSYSFPFSITFARLYGLVAVAVVGALLAFANTTDTLATAAFTLLGTVAGYLAGASATVVPANGPGNGPANPELPAQNAADNAGGNDAFL